MRTRGGRAENRRCWLKWLIGGIVSACLALSGAGADESTSPTGGHDTAVRLIVDYGDGVQKHFTELKWREGLTVFEVLQAAMRHPRGIRVKHRGRGETLLVTEIDELKSQATGAGSRNWIFRVNGQVGRRSAGISPVKAGDTVLWSFETYR